MTHQKIRNQKKLNATYLPVESPLDASLLCHVQVSTAADVQCAVTVAENAFFTWKTQMTLKSRANMMSKLYMLIQDHATELATLVVQESGKNFKEALAEIAKGNETVQYASGLPLLVQDEIQTVSSGGISCRELTEPVGVVASIVPFNFPAMVPLWTIPIALTLGNCVILKPSEKVPMTMHRIFDLFIEAGIPPGVFQILHGDAIAAKAIVDHPGISAVTFVGSSKVAKLVSTSALALNKRVLALGGAKNHLVALPDCNIDMASNDIVASFAGCAGQRCMAASVLLLVGNCDDLLNAIVAKASALKAGTEAGCVGAIIDKASHTRILSYVNTAADQSSSASLLVDGRSWATKHPKGYWIGPTIILHTETSDVALSDEIFGPVLSVLRVESYEKALEIENANVYGNAASIYTSSGANAAYFESKFKAGMIGVNIGVPVPREPFAFGGLAQTASKYGNHVDITAKGGISFFSNTRKITTKWGDASLASKTTMSSNKNSREKEDQANFSGQM